MKDKLLIDCTNTEVISFAKHKGYDLTEADCAALRINPIPFLAKTESVGDALDDFLNAFEH